ncbi:MAG: transcriptional regulator [Cyanobacteria bacterium P01_D01_bin.36]
MPSYSYRETQIEKLASDAEYASLYLETSFSEASKDGFVGGFVVALENVVEASSRRQSEPVETDTLRQRLHQKLNERENLTLEVIIDVLKEVGLTHEIKPLSAQVLR